MQSTDNPVIRKAVAADAELIHAALLQMAQGFGASGKIGSTPDDLRRYGLKHVAH